MCRGRTVATESTLVGDAPSWRKDGSVVALRRMPAGPCLTVMEEADTKLMVVEADAIAVP
jgi:hypothetical protein